MTRTGMCHTNYSHLNHDNTTNLRFTTDVRKGTVLCCDVERYASLFAQEYCTLHDENSIMIDILTFVQCNLLH